MIWSTTTGNINDFAELTASSHSKSVQKGVNSWEQLLWHPFKAPSEERDIWGLFKSWLNMSYLLVIIIQVFDFWVGDSRMRWIPDSRLREEPENLQTWSVRSMFLFLFI